MGSLRHALNRCSSLDVLMLVFRTRCGTNESRAGESRSTANRERWTSTLGVSHIGSKHRLASVLGWTVCVHRRSTGRAALLPSFTVRDVHGRHPYSIRPAVESPARDHRTAGEKFAEREVHRSVNVAPVPVASGTRLRLPSSTHPFSPSDSDSNRTANVRRIPVIRCTRTRLFIERICDSADGRVTDKPGEAFAAARQSLASSFD
jgi:hypothetical protein